MLCIFSEKSNDARRHNVHLRRLGTAGIYPFQCLLKLFSINLCNQFSTNPTISQFLFSPYLEDLICEFDQRLGSLYAAHSPLFLREKRQQLFPVQKDRSQRATAQPQHTDPVGILLRFLFSRLFYLFRAFLGWDCLY